MRSRHGLGFVGLLITVVLAGACSPSVAPSSAPSAGPSADASRVAKSLTIGVQRELQGFAKFTGIVAGGGSPGAGNNQVAKLAHAYLALETETSGVFAPQLAFELPSVEKGTWVVNPDGTMDTTWKLHPHVKWHDGTPFSAEDLVFGSALFRDTDYPVPPEERLLQVEYTSAPDPLTFVVHWKSTVASADDPTGFDPMPRHLMEPIYRTQKEQILITPLLSSEFVGLGPYKIARWQEGVEVEFVRFDDYFQGRAPFDRLLVILDERGQKELHRQLLHETTDDIALMSLYWQVDPVLVVKEIKGVTYNGTSNIFQWDKE
jgi:ABC-type transport system substrate-binding protein